MEKNFMREALKEAKKAYKYGEVPIGAVVVKNGKIIGRGYNKKELKNDATRHAEMEALKRAQRYMGNWYLEGCEIYVTLEPCAMCIGAMLNCRIEKIYIGAVNERMGACGSAVDLTNIASFNHKIEVEFGLLQKECAHIITSFFKKLRLKKSKKCQVVLSHNRLP